MRLLVAMLALSVAMVPLVVPSALADSDDGDGDGEDGTQEGCRISMTDPTRPAIYGDCIIFGGGPGVGDTTSAQAPWVSIEVALVTPGTLDCDAVCDRMITIGLDAKTTSGDNVDADAGDGINAPLGAYVTADLEAPQGEAEAGIDEGGFFASTMLTPFERA